MLGANRDLKRGDPLVHFPASGSCLNGFSVPLIPTGSEEQLAGGVGQQRQSFGYFANHPVERFKCMGVVFIPVAPVVQSLAVAARMAYHG